MRYAWRTLLLLCAGLCTVGVTAQHFGDPAYYLLDTLDLDALGASDRVHMDSTLVHYHAATTDTSRLRWLDHLVEECLDIKVWPRYNRLLLAEAQTAVDRAASDTVRRESLRYKLGSINNIGYFHSGRGNNDSALYYYGSILAIQDSIGDLNGKATTLNNMAFIHNRRGDIKRAEKMYREALALNECIDDKRSTALVLNNLGNIHRTHGDLGTAVSMYRDALHRFNELGARNRVAMMYNNLGTTLSKLGNADSAMFYYRKAMHLYAELGDGPGMALGWNNLAAMASEASLRDSALVLYRRALVGYEEIGDKAGRTLVTNNMAKLYHDQGDLPHALEAGQRALKWAREMNDPNHVLLATTVLHKVYRDLGRKAEAYDMLALNLVMKDSIRNEELKRQFTEERFRVAFEQEQFRDSLAHAEAIQQEQQLAERRVATQRARTQFASAVGGLLLAGGGVFFYLDRKRRRERFSRQAAELEARALRAQMDPHFIGNTLHAVNGYLLGHDPQAASTLLSRFAKWIRSTLESSRHETVPLGEDIEAMRTYLALEQARTGDRFTYTFDLPEDDELLHLRIPPMLVQPVLENAIVHGVLPLEGAGHITLKVQDGDDHLLILVEDNGVGRKAAPAAPDGRKKSSLSAQITRERLALMSARTGRPAGMRISDLPQGTLVELRLPLG